MHHLPRLEADIISRIFEPYFTTKSVEKGLSMGLAVVYGIVKKHEGAVKVVSEVGRGTTSEVLFPIIEEAREPDEAPSDNLPSGSERILFVDDEASLVKIGQQILEKQGYEVVSATSSAEALKRFQAEPDRYDLVISDMAMPAMTGDRLKFSKSGQACPLSFARVTATVLMKTRPNPWESRLTP